MANAYPTIAGGAGQGLLSGLNMGLQLGGTIKQNRLQEAQALEQKRQQEWEKGYKNAALAIQVAGINGIPDEMKARALNNGFLPLWNNKDFDVAGNNAAEFQPFTADSFQDKELHKTISEAKRLAGDKELAKNPELQLQAVTGLFMDYHAKKGKAAEAQKLALDLVKGDKDAEGKDFTKANQLRDQFFSQTKDFKTIRDAYQRVNDSAKEPSAAGDLALIFNYMKILDPGSTVREGEFANAAAAGSYGERIQAAAQKIVNGERLSDEMRRDFVSRAAGLFEGQENIYNKSSSEFKRLAKDAGLSENIFPESFTPEKLNMGGSGGKPKTIQQNGFTYTLNEQTGEYE